MFIYEGKREILSKEDEVFTLKVFQKDFLSFFIELQINWSKLEDGKPRFDCSEGIRKKPHKRSASDLLQHKTIVILISFKSLKNRIPRSQKRSEIQYCFHSNIGQYLSTFYLIFDLFWLLKKFESILKTCPMKKIQ